MTRSKGSEDFLRKFFVAFLKRLEGFFLKPQKKISKNFPEISPNDLKGTLKHRFSNFESLI